MGKYKKMRRSLNIKVSTFIKMSFTTPNMNDRTGTVSTTKTEEKNIILGLRAANKIIMKDLIIVIDLTDFKYYLKIQ